jgi:hypothetical protein
MFCPHHQPPPNGVMSASIDQPVGISASSTRLSAPSGTYVAFANNCPADYTVSSSGPGAIICSQSFHPDSWGYIAEALMLSKMIQFPPNAPLFSVVSRLCDGPSPSGYCAGLPR